MTLLTTPSSGTFFRRSADPFWDKVVMYLAFDEPSNRLLDLTGRHQPYIVGSANYPAGRFGGSSYWTNNDLNNRIEVPNSPDFHFGSGDFTVEFWCSRQNAFNHSGFVSLYRTSPTAQRSWGVWRDFADITFFASINNTGNDISIDTNVLDNTWTHLAITRSGDTFRVFYNGGLVGSQTLTGPQAGAALHPSTAPLDVGSWNLTHPARCYLDEVRITKGVARYTANFTPPAANFPGPAPLGDQLWNRVVFLSGFDGTDGATTFTDESQYNRVLTARGNAQVDTAFQRFGTGSLLLDGTGDAVTTPNDALLNLGNGPFTVEMFVRPASLTGIQFLAGQWSGVGNLRWVMYLNGTELCFNVSTDSSNNIVVLQGGFVDIAAWNHVCIDSDGATYRAYVNGVMVDSAPNPGTWGNTTNPLAIGANSTFDGFAFNGAIDECRITRAARHGSGNAFTVPNRAFPRGGGIPKAVENVAYASVFEQRAVQTDFPLLGVEELNEPFTTDTGQLILATEGLIGNAVFSGGTLRIEHTGERNTIVRTGDDIGLPLEWVEVNVVSRTTTGPGYNNFGVGIAKDQNNFIYASFDQQNALARVQVKIGGTNNFYGSIGYTFPASARVGFSLLMENVGVWVNTGTGWNLILSFNISSSVINMGTVDLTGWKPSFTVAASTTVTWVFDDLKAGIFGGVGLRDITLVTNADGSPVNFGGNYRFTGSSPGPTGASFNSVWEYNPTNYAINMIGSIMVNRGGVRYVDLNAHIVKNEDGTYRVVTASWGNGFGNVLQCFHKDDVGNIMEGQNLVSGMTQLTLPLIPGTGAGGAYDPYLVKIEGEWLLAYAVVDNTNFAGENFYIAAATSSDLVDFTGVGSDPTRTRVEGPKICKHNGAYFIYGGGRGIQPCYSIGMSYIGDPGFSPDLYNGVDTQPHAMIFPHKDEYHCLTWNAARFGSAGFTWGDFLAYTASRY